MPPDEGLALESAPPADLSSFDGAPLVPAAPPVVAALASGKLLEKMVFGVSAWDPLTLGAVAGALGLVALLASLVPAYRASRLDPQAALRAD